MPILKGRGQQKLLHLLGLIHSLQIGYRSPKVYNKLNSKQVLTRIVFKELAQKFWKWVQLCRWVEWIRRASCSLGWLFQVCNQIFSFLGLLKADKHHLCAGDKLFGVLQILEQGVVAPGDAWKQKIIYLGFMKGDLHKNVPLLMLASVYSKPGAWPVLRPKRPFRFGPVLCEPPKKHV